MTEIVLPEDTNTHGSVFGGRVLALIDKCAAAVAIRHARSGVLTLRLDSVEFRNPVHLGDILLLSGWVNAAFGSSMEIQVEVYSEEPTTGQKRLTTNAYVTMVGVGREGRPQKVPGLELQTDEERRRAEEAAVRRERRLNTPR
ncbi:hypothetical protein ABI59_01250 [Acidobacteria bacterium Mor1]|nr:hypothetical protein ABI59_01250 [Acidobacteria bacterium Mor1]